MKPYIHNPALLRHHFTGNGLPAFRGARMQHGRGLISKLKRYAVPILKAGASAAAPQLSKAASFAASQAAQQIFANNPAMQHMVSGLAGTVVDKTISKVTGAATKRKPTNKPAMQHVVSGLTDAMVNKMIKGAASTMNKRKGKAKSRVSTRTTIQESTLPKGLKNVFNRR